MDNVILTPITPELLIQRVAEKTAKLIAESNQPQQPTEKPDFLSEYVAKSEVRGKLASASTLWKYEKEGKLQSYGVGGKRFYKKEDVENLFIKLKKGGAK